MKKITFLGYLSFFFIGVFMNLLGVSLISMGKTFETDTAIIGYVYTSFAAFSTIAILLNGKLLNKVNLKKEKIIAIYVSGLGIVLLTMTDSLIFFGIGCALVGIGVGLLTSIINYIIIHNFEGSERSAKLNLANFYYSVGAIISPYFAGIIIKNKIGWQWNYRFVIIIVLTMLYLTLTSNFNIKKTIKVNEIKNMSNKWNLRFFVICILLFCYVMTEMIFTQWIVTYLNKTHRIEIDSAGFALSIFWVSMMVGRYLSNHFVKIFKLTKYIISSSVIAFVAFSLVFFVESYVFILVLVLFMGLGFSGLYASTISYGTNQQNNPSPMLMTFIITCGSIGGILSSPLASFIKRNLGIKLTLISGLFFLTFFVLTAIYSQMKYLEKEVDMNKVKNLLKKLLKKNIAYQGDFK